ncbi:MAG: DUF1919 domain-containing protein [Quinella sp. 1Q5]|nr:DUF1919 domain-containing protein [Quinella sp. 1Q5]
MLKVLIWQISDDTIFKNKAIKILEQQHNGIEIVGEAVNENIAKVDGEGQYDVLLVVGARQIGMSKKSNMSKVTQEAKQFNLPEEKILGDWIVTIPGFVLKKYRQLQRSRLSIFSINCFGGLMYNTLGLPFYSPFINMFLSPAGYFSFLHEPRVYMEKQLSFKENDPRGFPIFTLGNMTIFFNHYLISNETDFDRRRKRINWDNLFVEIYTEDEKVLQAFDLLPYAKKACFVPFKSDLNSAWYINPEINKNYPNFADKVNRFAMGDPFYYDIFDMLLYGKKTPLIDM